jgi:Flp pilus assembly protein TadG
MTRSVYARRRRFRRDARGAAAVEFAIVAPALITCIVGLLMLGITYYEGATVQWSLERRLRAAMIDPDATAAQIEAAIRSDLEQIGSPEIEFIYQVDDEGAVPLAVVTVNYDVPLQIPFLPDMALHFSAEGVAPAMGSS